VTALFVTPVLLLVLLSRCRLLVLLSSRCRLLMLLSRCRLLSLFVHCRAVLLRSGLGRGLFANLFSSPLRRLRMRSRRRALLARSRMIDIRLLRISMRRILFPLLLCRRRRVWCYLLKVLTNNFIPWLVTVLLAAQRILLLNTGVSVA
jgi:hypothetical protein